MKNTLRWSFLISGVVLVAAALILYLTAFDQVHASRSHPPYPGPVTLQAADLPKLDIAEVNLICAQGLPGAENLDIAASKAALDSWAKHVQDETARHLPKYGQNPAEYQNSEPYFRVLVLVTVLQQDFKVHYNPAQIASPDFSDSQNLFLHGLLGPRREGTCVSMPALYVAVGRRLGYPLKLVTTKAHLFARWEDSRRNERLNIEATNQGLNCFPDEYYRTWPVALSDDEIARGHYLKSLTPSEEMAVFLSTRGHCLEAAGRLPEAQLAHAQAHFLAPERPIYLAFLASTVKNELPDWLRIRVDLGQASPQRDSNQPMPNDL